MKRLRYRGPVKIVEQTGQWGVYSGERIVLGDGKSFQDDLGMQIRMAFDPRSAAAVRAGGAAPESFDLDLVEITVRPLRRRGRRRR